MDELLASNACVFVFTLVGMSALSGLGILGGLILARVRMRRVKKIMDEVLSK